MIVITGMALILGMPLNTRALVYLYINVIDYYHNKPGRGRENPPTFAMRTRVSATKNSKRNKQNGAFWARAKNVTEMMPEHYHATFKQQPEVKLMGRKLSRNSHLVHNRIIVTIIHSWTRCSSFRTVLFRYLHVPEKGEATKKFNEQWSWLCYFKNKCCSCSAHVKV